MIWSTFGRRLVQVANLTALKTLLGINPITINNDNWSGTDLSVANGGTGVSSFTAYAVICGGTTGTGTLQSIASVGSSGNVLTSNGAGALPTFQAAAAVDYGAGNAALSYGGIGTYVLALYSSNTPVADGATIAGSSLEPAGLTSASTAADGVVNSDTKMGKNGSALSGTWRSMGYPPTETTAGGTNSSITLFLRIS
jgi:hypothetical protein